MGVFQLGPLSVKYEWILMFLAGWIAYIVMKKVTEKDSSFQNEWVEAFMNSLFIYLLTYKFSIVIFRPDLIIDHPVALLYFTGGTRGSILGMIVIILYLIWKIKKHQWNKAQVVSVIVYGFVTFALSFWLLRTLFYLFF
ncbi:hypothetical protein LS684_10425 [Cytobacillus spongiae]|jgi:hypothetical protein|uniref:hypothetical protein n=1 Tax=Cytobacillus spongiae TaxID=2901381 RepID=UPI001F23F3DA|nr:hypothetical protein [Cytobacillus spongiae]UII54123.1 hypothetical protein LS684_10425 [Cytobacillus spongiae]